MKKPKKTHWYNQTPIPVSKIGNKDLMIWWVNFLSNTPNFRFVMNAPSTGGWTNPVLPSTTLKAINKGHLGINCWAYVNSLRSVPPQFRGNGPAWVAAEPPRHFVFDIDNVKDITGSTSQERVESLTKKLIANNCLLPYLTIETSPNNFHLVYLGTKRLEFTKEVRYALAERISGIPPAERSPAERDRLLREGGIDPAYLAQGIGLAKFRLPGSLNSKRSNIGFDGAGEAVIVYGVTNDQYTAPTKEQIDDLLGVRQTITAKPKKVPKKLPDWKWLRFMPDLREALADTLPKDRLEGVCGFLAKNYNLLQIKKNCRMHQEFMAKELGLEQYAVSRLLKKLREAGFLIKTREHERSVRAATYRAGIKLSIAFNKTLTFQKDYDINMPYVDHHMNDHYLKDIRYLVGQGTPISESVSIIMEKQQGRRKDSVRSAKEVESAIVSWLNRTQRNEEFGAG